jgi:hypothetical protein
MCLGRAPEKYIGGAKAPSGAVLVRAGLWREFIHSFTLRTSFRLSRQLCAILYIAGMR